MAYTSAYFTLAYTGPYNEHQTWLYVTTDTLSTVMASGYFSNAVTHGVRIGDVVIIKTVDELQTTEAASPQSLPDPVTPPSTVTSVAMRVFNSLNATTYAGTAGGFLTTAGQVTVTPAADSGAGSKIGSNVDSVLVSAVTNDANDWLVLPVGIPGMKIRGWSTVAHEIRTVASSNVAINGVDSDGTQEAAIPATTYWEVDYISASVGWILRAWTELGAPITAIVPD